MTFTAEQVERLARVAAEAYQDCPITDYEWGSLLSPFDRGNWKTVARAVAEAACADLAAEVKRLRAALLRSDNHLSLLVFRGSIRWGDTGIGQQEEYRQVIGESRRVLAETAPLPQETPMTPPTG